MSVCVGGMCVWGMYVCECVCMCVCVGCGCDIMCVFLSISYATSPVQYSKLFQK